MELTFGPRGILQINDAKIKWINFAGEAKHYYKKGEYGFTLIIPDQETADVLINDLNKYGVGWNVKIKKSEDDGQMYINLKVKVNFDGYRPPDIYLDVNGRRTKLDQESAAIIDDIDISSVDLDIAPSDGEGTFGPYRTAYLRSIWVYQEVDRFADRFADRDSYGM